MGVIFKNNVMYGAGDIEISPICYSEEEREVGAWTDGKPLYQKTVFPSISEINAHSFSDSDFTDTEMIMIIDGYYTLTDNYLKVALNQYETSSYWCRAGFRNDKSIYLYVNGYSVTGSASITVQYTKTTDTPGSGIWTPQGIPTVHYDGEEKVIGTWFGETLYEKSYQLTGIKGDNVIVDTTLTSLTIRPIHIYSSFYITGGAYQGVSFAHELTNGQFVRVGVNPSQGLFCDIDGYNTGYFGTDGVNVYITIQYIKITTL